MPRVNWRAKTRYFIVILLLFCLDQFSKQYILAWLAQENVAVVNEYLNFVLVYNHGIAFGLFSEHPSWQRYFFSVLSLLIALVLFVWLLSLPKKQTLLAWALAFILSGALGNVVDRLTLGYVIDFIDVHYQNHHWPAFNIADSSIMIGAAFLLIDTIWQKKSAKNKRIFQ